jgi:E3 ubiquitin-protein ligase ZNF598
MSATTSMEAPVTGNKPRASSKEARNRPRKTYHGSTSITTGLTIDRLKPQKPDAPKPDTAKSTPRRPPGLSPPPETVLETESKPEEDDPEGELCFICGNSMKGRYYSVAPCNNAFCHNCSLRLRALYKSTNCPFCKVWHLMSKLM